MSERDTSQIEQIADKVVIATRFFLKEETTTPPAVPQSEKEETIAKWKEAGAEFADFCIDLLLQPEVADIVCRDYSGVIPEIDLAKSRWKYDNTALETSTTITLFREDVESKPRLQLTVVDYKYLWGADNPEVKQQKAKEEFEKFKTRMINDFPEGDNNAWDFKTEPIIRGMAMASEEVIIGYNKGYLRMVATKSFTGQDAVSSEGVFFWFMDGINRDLDGALYKIIRNIDNRTITEDHAAKLKAITKICSTAVEQIKQVLSTEAEE